MIFLRKKYIMSTKAKQSKRKMFFSKTSIVLMALVSLGILSLIGGGRVLAQSDMPRHVLDPILVTANRIIQELMDVPITVNVVTSEDLEREPAATIADVLRNLPGINLNESGSAKVGAPEISIRGESSARTLIFINGVKLADKENSDPSVMIDLSQVERIEVIKGPASVLYGSEAIGGVINIITKKAGDKPIGFSTTTVYDSSNESLDIQAAIFGRYKGFNYRFSASGINAKDRHVPKDSVDGSTAYNSNFRNRYYLAQVGYDWGDNSFSLQADMYKNYTRYALTGSASIRNGSFMWLDPNDRKTIIANLVLRDLTSRLKRLNITASYQIYKRNMVTDRTTPGSSATSYMLGEVITDQRQLSFSALSEWDFNRHYLTAGIEYEGDDLRVTNQGNPYNPNRPKTVSHAKVRQNTIGIFAQDEWSLTNVLKATLGARFSYIEGKVKHLDGSYIDRRSTDHSDTNLVGSVGLVYRGINNLALRGQFSQGYRYPSTRQLYTGNSAHGVGTFYYPNPDLKPETSNSFEIGARYLGDNWDIDFALFYTKSKNFINSVSASLNTMGNFATYINAGQATTYGAELSISYNHKFNDVSLMPYGWASIIRRKLTLTEGVDKGKSTSHTDLPPLEGRLGVKFDMPFSGSNHFYGDLFVMAAVRTKDNFSADASDITASSTILDEPVIHEAWQTLNLTLGVQGGEQYKYNLSLSFRNIFNQSYIMARGRSTLPEPGFHVVLGAGIEF